MEEDNSQSPLLESIENEESYRNSDDIAIDEYFSEAQQEIQEPVSEEIFIQDEWNLQEVKYKFVTTKEILKEKLDDIRTMESFDNLVKGIAPGDIFEICGKPQTGKTLLVTSLAINVLCNYPDIKISFIDTKNDIHANHFHKILKIRGYDEETIMEKIFNRIFIFKPSNLSELIDTLKLISEDSESMIIIIDSITVPFYHAFANNNFRLIAKLTTDIHQLLFELKNQNKIIITTNLLLNPYNPPKTKRTDQDSEEDESVESENEEECESECDSTSFGKPALGKYWSEILDYRVLISLKDESKEEVFEYFKPERKLTVLLSNKILPLNSIIVKITDKGVV